MSQPEIRQIEHEVTELRADVFVLREHFEKLYRLNVEQIFTLKGEVSSIARMLEQWHPPDEPKPEPRPSERVREKWGTKAAITGMVLGGVIVGIAQALLR